MKKITDWLRGLFTPQSNQKNPGPCPDSSVSNAKMNELYSAFDLAWMEVWNNGAQGRNAFDSGKMIRQHFDDNWILYSKQISKYVEHETWPPPKFSKAYRPYISSLKHVWEFMRNYTCGYIATAKIGHAYNCPMLYLIFKREKSWKNSWTDHSGESQNAIIVYEYIGIYLPVNSLLFDVL